MGYLQFSVMKRDKLIEKYCHAARPEGFQLWRRWRPVAMNEALLSNRPTSSAAACPA
jgi:NitT/TauT family transport system substrate-binding protein